MFVRYKILKEIPKAFHNGSTYDFHFIIKVPGQLEWVGENTKKYITFITKILRSTWMFRRKYKEVHYFFITS